jgi:hypothetical protein
MSEAMLGSAAVTKVIKEPNPRTAKAMTQSNTRR